MTPDLSRVKAVMDPNPGVARSRPPTSGNRIAYYLRQARFKRLEDLHSAMKTLLASGAISPCTGSTGHDFTAGDN